MELRLASSCLACRGLFNEALGSGSLFPGEPPAEALDHLGNTWAAALMSRKNGSRAKGQISTSAARTTAECNNRV